MDTDEDSKVFSLCSNETINTTINDDTIVASDINSTNINEAQVKLHLLNELVSATSVQMCAYLQCLLIISRIISTVRKKKNKRKR
jgi:hypothetical protein